MFTEIFDNNILFRNMEKQMMPIWSINHCRIKNGQILPENHYSNYYSCGVDSIVDLFDYAVCANLSEHDIQNKSELLKLIYECHQLRQTERFIFEANLPQLSKRIIFKEILEYRMNISMKNNIVWDWLCTYDTNNWCQPRKGTADAELYGIPTSLIKTDIDKQFFGLNLLWKCKNSQCGIEMNEHLFPVNLLNCSSIRNGMDESMHSTCRCDSDRSFTIENIGEYLLFDLSIISLNAVNFHVEETLTINGNDQMELVGAIKHTTQHFIPIVKIENKWHVLDGMQDEPIIATKIDTCLHVIDYDRIGKMMGVCWLLYRKIADTVVNIGDESVEMETETEIEISSSNYNSNDITIKATASKKAKDRKRKRDNDYYTMQKRIIGNADAQVTGYEEARVKGSSCPLAQISPV
jgi:hypothetical protein